MMTNKRCRNSAPTIIDRFLQLFGYRTDLHAWRLYCRFDLKGNLIFYCRKCECGADEVKNDGPMGNRRWASVDAPMRNKWEREAFDNALIGE